MKWQKLKKIACLGAVCVAGAVMAESTVSISVQDTEMRDVLKFISEQSGSSIVISPDVSTKTLDINLQDVELSEALDVILKPYGCGYRKVGSTVVVDKLDNLDRLCAVEPLVSTVVTLKYLDAKGVVEIVDGMLSNRGSVKMLTSDQKLGWDFVSAGENDGQGGKLDRAKADESVSSSKILVVTDTPSVLTRIRDVINEVDIKPRQIEIRSFFVEFSNDAGTDIGVDWSVNKDSGEYNTGGTSTDTNDVSSLVNALAGTAFESAESSGMSFGVLRESDYMDISVQLTALEKSEDANVLSAPRVVTQENQEASILVGEKYPIITSESDGDSGQITVELDYFERIGIQLNVIPQICDDNRISLVIHPAVSSLGETVNASIISTDGDSSQLATPFPRIFTREAETRLTVKDGEMVAIGGLVSEEESLGEEKVPLLGDIPLLGKLFRREYTSNDKTELVILMSATVQAEQSNVSAELNKRVDNSVQKVLGHWNENSMD